MNYDEIIMSLTEIAEQPTTDGIVDGVNQQTIRDALELLKGQEQIDITGICGKGNTHGYAETWSRADGERR